MAEETRQPQVEEGDLSQTEEPHQQQGEQQHPQVADDEQAEQQLDNDEQAEQQVDDDEQAEQQVDNDEQAEQQLEDDEQAEQEPEQAADDTDSSDGAAECIICFTPYDGIFKLPKMLRCGHTFCLECLARINVSSEAATSVSCPVCRNTTQLPARRGLPALDNNPDILMHIPQEQRPNRSVRFSRKKGLLYVKNAPSPQNPLPKDLQLSTISLSLDVGRPAPRVRVPPNFGRGGWLFYTTVGIAILLTIAVTMVGVYIFFIVPNGMHSSNNSSATSHFNMQGNPNLYPPYDSTDTDSPDGNTDSQSTQGSAISYSPNGSTILNSPNVSNHTGSR